MTDKAEENYQRLKRELEALARDLSASVPSYMRNKKQRPHPMGSTRLVFLEPHWPVDQERAA